MVLSSTAILVRYMKAYPGCLAAAADSFTELRQICAQCDNVMGFERSVKGFLHDGP